MREVILMVGPPASGRSTFCKKALEFELGMIYVSGDEQSAALFDNDYVNLDSEQQQAVWDQMWILLEACLKKEDVKILLDVWNLTSYERLEITTRLRNRGAEVVVAWRFITPLETCKRWYFEKDGSWITRHIIREYFEQRYDVWYRAYHEYPVETSQGFDRVCLVNPVSFSPRDVLPLQTSLIL
jgi:Chromatin associated protein KTI12.